MKKIVILIHGYLTDQHDFNQLEKKLLPYYDYVVILDLPGHGFDHSMKDFKVDATLDYVDKEVEFYLKMGDVDLIGYSLGGALVRYLCVKYKKINKAVLLAPASKYLNFSCLNRRMKYYFSGKTKEEKSINRKILKGNDEITRYIAKTQFFKNIRPSNIKVFRRLIKKTNSQKGDNPTSTLIIYGKLDELVPKKSAIYCFNNCINQSKELVLIDGVGHVLLKGVKGKEIEEKIIKFLN